MSGIATGTALAIGLGTSAAAGIGGSLISGSTQASAAKSAQQLQAEEAQNALDFQKQQYSDTQANQAPWLAAGKDALGNLSSQFGNGGPQWNQTFTAPTAATEQNDPGYAFRLQQGEQALQNSAAASGNLLTGGTAKSLENYAQDYASNEYGNVYNRALGQYQQNYNQFQQAQNNTFNREAAISGVGQTAANTLATAGQQAANTTANIDLTTGQQQGQDLQNAGAATASGYAGAANALGSLGGSIGNYGILQQILAQQGNNAGWGSGTVVCWVAAELYGGWLRPQTLAVRKWMYAHPAVLEQYRKYGPELAERIKTDLAIRAQMRTIFDGILQWEVS